MAKSALEVMLCKCIKANIKVVHIRADYAIADMIAVWQTAKREL